MMKDRRFEVGDIIEVTEGSLNNTMHRWYKNDDCYIQGIGGLYKIEDVDYTKEGEYVGGYTVLINGIPYGSLGIKLIEAAPTLANIVSALDLKIEAMEERIKDGI